MSATTTRHAALRPGSTAVPSLRPWKQTVTSARTAAPTTAPVEPSTPDGTSSATIVPIGGRIASMAWATAPRGAPRKPVPRRASTTTSARLSRARRTPSTTAIPRRLAMSWFRRASGGSFRASPASRHSTSQPAACRWRATTNPSPPLLPAPQTTAALPEPPEAKDLVGGCEARALHEHRARDAELADGPGVDRPHLVGGVERERAAHASCTMATAAAIPLECVMERSMPPALTRAAHAAVRPVRLTPGFGRPDDLDLAPRERDAEPERLSDGLLAREPGGEVLRRVGARQAVLALGRREHALDEPGVADEGTRNPVDLDQVDPNPHGGHTMLGPCHERFP